MKDLDHVGDTALAAVEYRRIAQQALTRLAEMTSKP